MADDAFDAERLDDIILALLWANSFEQSGSHRSWKSLPWDSLDRLHERGLISNPGTRARSVTLTDEAVEHGRVLFERWFAATASDPANTAGNASARSGARGADATEIHQFKITLDDIEPPIWRRIQLPGDATFWDLHCAINDAMGWQDMHLHVFEADDRKHAVNIGIPIDDDLPWRGAPVQAGWEVPIASVFEKAGDHCVYRYDFGDDWSHQIVLEAVVPRDGRVRYPRCIDGARACPPEDCGGAPGYTELLSALARPEKADAWGKELLEWLGDDFEPEHFDPREMTFHAAKPRLKALLQGLRQG